MLSRDSELAIDLCRGITALLVMIGHVLGPVVEPFLGLDYNTWPRAWQVLGFTLGGGRFWVRFFFVISGFCIHLSISRSIEKGGFSLRSYIIARLTRIYPVFLVGLALAVANWWLFSPVGAFPAKELVASLAMLQQFIGTFPAFAPSWSLTSEVCYYAVWPLALLACGLHQRTTLRVCAGLALLVTLLIVAVWKLRFGGDKEHWLIPFWSISGLFFVWLGGAWLAIEWKTIQSWITPRLLNFGLLWVLVIYLAEGALAYYQARSWPYMVADYLAIPGFVMVIAGGHLWRLSSSPRWTALARWMGTFSYPCYLLHVVVFEMARATVKWLALPIHPFLQALLALALTLTLIVTFGMGLERTVMSWRSGFLKRLAAGS